MKHKKQEILSSVNSGYCKRYSNSNTTKLCIPKIVRRKFKLVFKVSSIKVKKKKKNTLYFTGIEIPVEESQFHSKDSELGKF